MSLADFPGDFLNDVEFHQRHFAKHFRIADPALCKFDKGLGYGLGHLVGAVEKAKPAADGHQHRG